MAASRMTKQTSKRRRPNNCWQLNDPSPAAVSQYLGNANGNVTQQRLATTSSGEKYNF
jgi:hypothetical protein